MGLAVFFAAHAATNASGGGDPASVVTGASVCPTPIAVGERLAPLVPSQVLVDRFADAGKPAPPIEIVDLGPSFRVTIGTHVREYAEETRDCAKRAQLAALFVALVAGANTSSTSAPPPPVDSVAAAPPAVAAPAVARFRLDVGATAATALGAGEPMIAPGLTVRIVAGNRRLLPVAAVTVLGPFDGDVGGVQIRQWQAVADVGVRSSSWVVGRSRLHVELGAAVELLSDRPTNLAAARSQISYAVGPRVGAGWLLATRGQLSPFALLHAIWYPRAPELFALPFGDLGRSAPWNLGAVIGASWGWL